MIAVVVDTNILNQSPKLTRKDWVSLAEKKDDWEVTLIIPEIVMMETTKVVPRSWAKERDNLKKARIGTFGLQDELDAMVQRIQDQIDGYEAQLKKRASELGVQVAPTPNIPHLDIALRASRGTAPYHAGDKDGYRDTLIWLTVLDVATGNPEHVVWFVSDNTTDFGDPEVKRRKDEKEEPSHLPRELHPHLKEELERAGLQNRVQYATSLEALEQHIASMHGSIGDDDLQELIDSVNWQDLAELLNDQTSIVVPARDLALNIRFAHGVVNQLLPLNETWVFSDAAYRGDGRWTANYSIDVNAEILAFTSDQSEIPFPMEKPLRVSGTVAFTKEGEPQSVQVSRVEALPGDPERYVWSAIVHSSFWPRNPSLFQSLRDAAGLAAGWKATEQQAETFRRVADLGKLSDEQTESFRRAANMASWKPSAEQTETFRRIANMGKLSHEQAEALRRAANMAEGAGGAEEEAPTHYNAVDKNDTSLTGDNLTGEHTPADDDEPNGKG